MKSEAANGRSVLGDHFSDVTQSAGGGRSDGDGQAMLARAPRSRLRGRRPAIGALTLVIALLVGVLFPTPASANLPGSRFNAADGRLDTGVRSASDLPSGGGDDSYGGGAKENDLCPRVVDGSIPPSKDDLIRFHADIEITNNTPFLYLAWERTNNLGTATIDFELNQAENAAPNCNGVNPPRTVGDLLITYDFRGGGRPQVFVRTWLGSAWSGARELSATVAERSISSNLLLGEISINLITAGIVLPTRCVNFSSAFVKSRASTSFPSELKDFIGGAREIDLPPILNCADINIRKVNDAGTPLRGATFALFTVVNNAPGVPVTPAKTCSTGATGTCTITDVLQGSYFVVETVTPANHATALPQRITVVGGTTALNLRFVNPRILANIAILKVNDATPPARLAGVTFRLHNPNAAGTGPGSAVSPARTCTTSSDGTCTISGVPLGTYWVVEVAPPAGHTAAAPQRVVLSGAGTVNLTFVNPRIITPTLSVSVVKTNDADGNGAFTDSEIARTVGQAVPFRAVITNTSSVPVVLTALTDVYPGRAAFTPPECASLINATPMDPGGSRVCNFTVPNYAPTQAAGSVVNTVRAVVAQPGNLANTRAAQDTSTVFPPPLGNLFNVAVDKDDAGATFRVGQNGTYTIVVTNGPVTSPRSFPVTDDLPTGLTFVSGTGTNWSNCSAVGQEVTCTYTGPALAPRASTPPLTLTVAVGPTAASTVTNRVEVDHPDDTDDSDDRDEEDTPVVRPNLAIDKDDAGATFTVGQNGTYTLRVRNAGTASMTAPFPVRDTLPTGLTFVSGAGTSWSNCSAVGQVVTCTYTGPVLVPGAPAPPITLTVAVGPDAASTVTNRVEVDHPDDTDDRDDKDEEDTPVVRPSLSVTVVKTNDANGDGTFTDGEIAPTVGATVPFRAVITNTSAVPVVLTTLTDVYPGRAAFTPPECAPLLNTTLTVAGTPNATVTCNFIVANYAPTQAAGSLVNTVRAVVTQPGNPTNTAPGQDTSTVFPPPLGEPVERPDLRPDKDDRGTTFTVGQNGTYTIVVTNVGGAATDPNISFPVVDTLPRGLGFVSADGGPTWTCSAQGQLVTCTYRGPAIAPGASAAPINLTVSVSREALPSVTNRVRVTYPDDGDRRNDEDAEETPVIQVLGEEIVRESSAPVEAAQLARTGASTATMAIMGLLLLLVGLVLVRITKPGLLKSPLMAVQHAGGFEAGSVPDGMASTYGGRGGIRVVSRDGSRFAPVRSRRARASAEAGAGLTEERIWARVRRGRRGPPSG